MRLQFISFYNSARRLSRSDRAREWSSIAIVVGLATIMVWRGLTGDWPVGHDHSVHLFRIWQLQQTLLHHGSFWGWTQRWFAGCPTGGLYPIGADLLVLIVHALLLGRASIPQSYGVAFWLFYCLHAYAVFYFVSRALRSRTVAIVAVLLLISEAGNNDVGGWFWFVDVGVWTAALAMVPALIGTIQISRLFDNPAPRCAAIVAVCIGLALLCHQLAAVYFALAVPLLCGCRFVVGEPTRWRAGFGWLAVGGVCGLLIAAFWWAPNFSLAPYLANIGWLGKTISDLGQNIERLELFPRMWWLPAGAGLIGSFALLFGARTSLALFVGAFGFLALTLSSSSAVQLFGPRVAEWAGKHMIFMRLLMLAKPCWCAAAALLIVRATRCAVDLRLRYIRWSGVRTAVAATFVLLFVAPLAYFAVKTFLHDELFRPTEWHSKQRDAQAREQFVAWINALPRKPGEFYRIAHGFGPNYHEYTDLGARLPCPMYKVSNTPTGDHFLHSFESYSADALRAMNVRFALVDHPMNRRDFVLDRTFAGKLRVYRVTTWNPNPFVVKGTGTVQLLKFKDERVVLRALPGASGKLRVNITYIRKWTATRDGVPVAITGVADPALPRSSFIEVPLAAGVYRFQYHRTFADYFGSVLAAIGCLGCLALWRPDLAASLSRKIRRPSAAKERHEQT
ncbi:MAG: hypothetical protein ACJ8IQ_07725 [Chthoniobacterales bacterium]